MTPHDGKAPGYQQDTIFPNEDTFIAPPPLGGVWFPRVLMIAVLIILILVPLAYVMIVPQPEEDWPTPKIKLRSSYQEDGFFIVNITDVDGSCSVVHGEFYLEDGNGTLIPGVCGHVTDIYGLNMFYKGYNFSFMDNDRDGEISAGDNFTIRSVEDGGPADVGMIFELRFSVTGKTMGTVRLSKENEH